MYYNDLTGLKAASKLINKNLRELFTFNTFPFIFKSCNFVVIHCQQINLIKIQLD